MTLHVARPRQNIRVGEGESAARREAPEFGEACLDERRRRDYSGDESSLSRCWSGLARISNWGCFLVSLSRFQELLARQRALHEQFRDELARCVAQPPHGYASCQYRFQRLQEQIDDIDAHVRAVGGHLRLVPSPSSPASE